MGDTLVCSIELSKTDGITVTVDNAAGSILQTIVINGTTIVTTVAGEENTTTLTQTADSFVMNVEDGSTITQSGRDITFDCTNWTVNATKVSVNSTGHTTMIADADLTLKSAGSMELSASSGNSSGKSDDEADSPGSATLDLKSEKAMSLTSEDKWTTSATMDAALSSDTKTTISGSTQVAVSSDTKVAVDAVQVEVSGSAQATFSGAITKVGQDVTTISGSVVSVEGNLVKLG